PDRAALDPEEAPPGPGRVLDADGGLLAQAGTRRGDEPEELRSGPRGRPGLRQPGRRAPGGREGRHLVRDRLAAGPVRARDRPRDRPARAAPGPAAAARSGHAPGGGVTGGPSRIAYSTSRKRKRSTARMRAAIASLRSSQRAQ